MLRSWMPFTPASNHGDEVPQRVQTKRYALDESTDSASGDASFGTLGWLTAPILVPERSRHFLRQVAVRTTLGRLFAVFHVPPVNYSVPRDKWRFFASSPRRTAIRPVDRRDQPLG